eukprot:1161779-Pelagomonas_calceolata.AAC.8
MTARILRHGPCCQALCRLFGVALPQCSCSFASMPSQCSDWHLLLGYPGFEVEKLMWRCVLLLSVYTCWSDAHFKTGAISFIEWLYCGLCFFGSHYALCNRKRLLNRNVKERKKAYAGRNQRALRKDPTVSAVTDHKSHQYLNYEKANGLVVHPTLC